MFKVVNKETGEPYSERAGEQTILYATGPEAARAASHLNLYFGVKHFQPRRAEGDKKWREREQKRFDKGEYKPVDWAPALHRNPAFKPNPDHFVHVSKNDPNFVAYTPDDEYGEYDRQTSIRVGSYLKRFHEGDFTKVMLDQITTEIIAKNDQLELKFATTPDEIEHVYTHGPSSCMSHERNEYRSGKFGHPTRVYGAGDLAVAYIERQARITARSLCWPEKKIFSRVYGDGIRLIPLLQAAGFSELDRSNAFEGARLIRHKLPGQDRRFVLPYIDNHNYAYDNGEYLVLGRPKDKPLLHCGETCGVVHASGETCPACSKFTQSTVPAYDDEHTSRQICLMCAQTNYVTTHYEGVYIRRDQVVSHRIGRDMQTMSKWFAAREITTCDRTGETMLKSRSNEVNMGGGVKQRWGDTAAGKDAVTCAASHVLYAREACIQVRLDDLGGQFYIAREHYSERSKGIRVSAYNRYSALAYHTMHRSNNIVWRERINAAVNAALEKEANKGTTQQELPLPVMAPPPQPASPTGRISGIATFSEIMRRI